MLEEFECVEWNTTDRNVSVGKTTVRNLTPNTVFADTATLIRRRHTVLYAAPCLGASRGRQLHGPRD